MILSFILYRLVGYELVTIIFMIVTTIVCGYAIFIKSIKALRYKIIGIETLVTIAVIGAIIIGEYYEAAAVTYLFLLGEFLEAKTIEKTRSSIKKLLSMAPTIARVKRNGIEIEIYPDDVSVGEIVIVKHGEKIAIDGKVIKGEGSVNQSAITGESIAVYKNYNSDVYSGTILENGYLEIEATKVGDDTTFSKILEMVEEAQDKKAKSQKFIERFARYYTPLIIVITIILYLVKKDIHLALTLLVISCPGALVISTPVSIVAGIGNGAKRGILYKGGEAIEKLAKTKVIAFDKTGTITIGKPKVTKVKGIGIDENEVIRLSGIGESFSIHPLALAIINKAKDVNQKIDEEVENLNIINGRGIVYTYNNVEYLLGNKLLLDENNIFLNQEILKYVNQEERKAQTVVFLANSKQLLGIISIKDTVRENAKESIAKLKKQGVKKIVMLTGDNEGSASVIASEVGIDSYYSNLLPEEKVLKVKELKNKYKNVVMVGDGVNDAPALATADLGIAIGGIGKDVAMETADIILMSEKVENINYAYDLSKKTNQNLKQNIVFALLVAIFLLLGVVVKVVDLAIGMLVHELSVLLVIINAIRLLSYKKGDRI